MTAAAPGARVQIPAGGGQQLGGQVQPDRRKLPQPARSIPLALQQEILHTGVLCSHCKIFGHLAAQCWRLHGIPLDLQPYYAPLRPVAPVHAATVATPLAPVAQIAAAAPLAAAPPQLPANFADDVARSLATHWFGLGGYRPPMQGMQQTSVPHSTYHIGESSGSVGVQGGGMA